MQWVFRAADERLRSRMDRPTYRGRRPVICECSDPECLEVLELTRAEYSRVRARGNFAIAHGHVTPEVERVVESCDGYDVVSKD